jgi:hypothetical protein
MVPEELLIFQIKALKSGRINYQQVIPQTNISILIEECKFGNVLQYFLDTRRHQDIARGSWIGLLGREYRSFPGSTGCAIF